MQYIKQLKYIITAVVILMMSLQFTASAQKIDQQNLSSVKVDELSDQQIKNIVSQVKGSGIPEDQVEEVLLSRGLPAGESVKFKQRVAKLNESNNSINNLENDEQASTVAGKKDLGYEAVEEVSEKSKIFGSQIFSKAYSNLLQVNPNRPTPKNYVLGPGDQLQINIYGNSVASWNVSITPEGYASLPGMGNVYLSGKTIEQGTRLIKERLRANNYAIGNGTDATISLTNIRSIEVSIIGEVKRPGTYTMTSLQSVLNALYTSGGPTAIGSFRQIEIIRDNRLFSTFDVYDVLLNGDLSKNIFLQDDDIIRVPVSKITVSTSGEVKRPGIYEMLSGETFEDVLNFSGGFTDNAYTERVKVIQLNNKEKSVKDIDRLDFTNYIALKGDAYHVDPILDRFANRITINGAVFRPGQFELTSGLTLSQLIKQAEGLKEDAFAERGYITRLNANNNTEIIPFHVANAAQGISDDILLKREDVITIPSIFDLKESQTVAINGLVRKGGRFPYSENMTVEDLVLMAGGLQEGASRERIEVSRRVINRDASSSNIQTAQIFAMSINADLSVQDSDFKLQAFDIITIRPEAGYEVQRQVKLEGEVLYPGTYTITNKDERISDIIKRAGGLTAFAYEEGASLERPGKKTMKDFNAISETKNEEEAQLANLQRLSGEGAAIEDLEKIQGLISSDLIGIEMHKILEKPYRKADLILEDGDIIRVPKLLQTVKVNGEVLMPNNVIFKKGKGFKHYVNSAGGFTQEARKKGAYIQYANGSVDATSKTLLFFNNYPEVKPGAEIFIPQRAPREKVSAQGWVGISSAVVSMAALIFNLVK